ncbi:MAG: STAS domain-containing protein [Solirubrobacteraceae bacterium]
MEARDTTVWVLVDPIADGDARRLCDHLQALLTATGVEVIACDVGALAATAGTVDALARLELTAGRLGRRIVLRRASEELLRLVAFVGLADVLGCRGRDGEAEERKQPRRVEERVDGDDAAV